MARTTKTRTQSLPKGEMKDILFSFAFAGKREILEDGVYICTQDSVTCMVIDADRADTRAAKAVIRKAGKYPMGLLVVGKSIPGEMKQSLLRKEFTDYLSLPVSPEKVHLSIRNIMGGLIMRKKSILTSQRLNASLRESKELTNIGIALSAEKDLGRLLGMIVEKARFLPEADAGSLYIVEEVPPEAPGMPPKKRLRFKIAQNDSINAPYTEFTLEINTASIAGYIAVTGKSINVPDVYRIPSKSGFTFNKSFDQKFGYRTKSMLVVPMKNHHGEIIGVLQLMNRKKHPEIRLTSPEIGEKEVIPFNRKNEDIVESLANQAAVALENTLLYEEIQMLFDSFVRASVSAIESRDPTTSGHSSRVAHYSVELAAVVDRADTGPYGAVRFTREELKELEYAGLLHDFGKIGVREQVLVKAKKLYEPDFSLILSRFAYIRKNAEVDFLRQKLDAVIAKGVDAGMKDFPWLEEMYRKNLEELDKYISIIASCNIPTVLQEGDFKLLQEVGGKTFLDADGRVRPYLTGEEVLNLSLPKGSLNDVERKEIESHVAHTYEYLRKIPWAKKIRRIPDIAYAHHEKLNGSGYPKKMTEDQIPLQAKIMTISDIYDALTASDRPYKKAVPPQKALDILGMEVKAKQLDPVLFQLFVEAKVYEKIPHKN